MCLSSASISKVTDEWLQLTDMVLNPSEGEENW